MKRKYFIVKDHPHEFSNNQDKQNQEPEPEIEPEQEIENYEKIARNYTFKNNKKPSENKYITDDNVFSSFYGTRQEVWDKKAYNTTGGLTRDDLMLNKLGKIVSKRKSAHEFSFNRFELCGINKKKEKKIEDNV